MENGSLLIANAAKDDSGIWTIQAENGLGVETKQIILNVYPSRVPIQVKINYLTEDNRMYNYVINYVIIIVILGNSRRRRSYIETK